MAKKNKKTTVSEPLVSNAPLMDAQLSADTNAKTSSKKSNTKKSEQKMKMGARIRKAFKEMFSELKKVSWPTAKKTLSMFGIVLVVVFFFLVVISAFDYGIINLVELLMKNSVV
ncbi:MAG: preprotein translocase subunit SecE [Clostridia bacterium]|nr:preprotein translocase subunit SecE [Clostridia bacterium]MDE7329129.1 preprotein translocase subunit SecE [Clostridia bacterium]